MSNFYTADFFEKSKKSYSESFFKSIFDDIKADQENGLFRKAVTRSCGKYAYLVNANRKRLILTEQKKLFDLYRKHLLKAQELYREIQDHIQTSGKYNSAIREIYTACKDESGMQEMFSPYCTESGIGIDVLYNFLGHLARATEIAKNKKIGLDKSDLSNDFLIEWVAVIGFHWPKEAKVRFALGKYESGVGGYSSRCIPIMHKMISYMDDSVTEKNIENALRAVIRKGIKKQYVANVYLR